MARTVEDNALVMNVIAGHDPMDDTSVELPAGDYTQALRRGVRGMQIGIPGPGLSMDFILM